MGDNRALPLSNSPKADEPANSVPDVLAMAEGPRLSAQSRELRKPGVMRDSNASQRRDGRHNHPQHEGSVVQAVVQMLCIAPAPNETS